MSKRKTKEEFIADAKRVHDGSRKLVRGVGINDVYLSGNRDVYERWVRMLSRCYGNGVHKKYPRYIGCYMCNDWLYFSRFKTWYEEHGKPTYAIDKDILFKGNKCYSPETCCCVPIEINGLFTKSNKTRGIYPIGVSYDKESGKFLASMRKCGKIKKLGRFKTVQDAFLAYKAAKEEYIKEIAQKYYDDGSIERRVYDAMMKYEVEITD